MYTQLTRCVACDSYNLHQFLDLDKQPLANNYHDGTGSGEKYPLALNVCTDCWHTQLSVSVDPSILFDHYLYVTGTNQTIKDYSDWFASYVLERNPDLPTIKVLDIACNDGTQLDSFTKLSPTCETYGVDPAKNLIGLAEEKGHTVYNEYWPFDLGQKFEVIIAQNVCAHTPSLYDFMVGIRNHLALTGEAYIQTSQSQMYQNNEFDTTYHEHISFFSVNSMNNLAHRAGLTLKDVQITDIHGGSYLFTLGVQGSTKSASVRETMIKEDSEGRHSLEFYRHFGINADTILDDLEDVICAYQSNGVAVVGYGAAAKGMTVLNARGIKLDWIVDDNPLKQGLYTPGTNIPIKDRSSLHTDLPLVVIPLAWNFFNEIKDNVDTERKGKETTYIKYFPKVTVT